MPDGRDASSGTGGKPASPGPNFTIFKNSFFVAVSLLAKLVLYTFLARQFEKEDMGIIFYALAIMELVRGMSSFGVPQLAVRELSRGQEKIDSFFSNLLGIRFLSALAALGLLGATIAAGFFSDEKEQVWIIILIALAVIPRTLSECLDIFFAVSEKFIYPASLEILNQVLFAAGCISLLLFDAHLVTVALYFLGVTTFTSLLRVLILRGNRYFSLRELSLDKGLAIFRKLVPFGITGLALIFYLRIGDVLIVKLAPEGITELAIFKMAHFPILAVVTLLGACVMPFYASITKIDAIDHRAGLDRIEQTLHKTIRYLLILGCLFAIGPTLFAEEIMVFLCGEKWSPSAFLLKLMLWHASLAAITAIVARTLQAIGRQKAVAVAGLALLLIKAGLLVIFLPAHGALGLTVITIVSTLLYIVYSFILLKICCVNVEHRAGLMKTVFAAAIAVVCAWTGLTGMRGVDMVLCYLGFGVLIFSLKALRFSEVRDIARSMFHPSGA